MAARLAQEFSKRRFEQLNTVATQANELLHAQHKQTSQHTTLLHEVVQLRKRRRELESRLASDTVGGRLLNAARDQQAAQAAPAPDLSSRAARTELTATVVQTAKRRKTHDLHLGYRLSGLTLFPLAQSKTGVRFDTVHKGVFLEQYYLILHLSSADQPVVHKHTLPAFVPLAELMPLLDTDVHRFLSAIADHLNAYVSRREQLRELQAVCQPFLVEQMECSVAVDFVRLAVASDAGAPVVVRLIYEDLLSTRPTRCIAQTPDPDQGFELRLRAEERLFLQLPLVEAFKMAFGLDQ